MEQIEPEIDLAVSHSSVQHHSIVTKDDFEPAKETSVDEVVNNILNIVPENIDVQTEVHHDMLLKLKNKIANGKHWLSD